MIRGRGYLKNYVSGEDDMQLLSRRHHSLRGWETQVGQHSDNYRTKFRRCPIARIWQYDPLIQSYHTTRKTIEDQYFDLIESNFCYLCSLNEPGTFDHFHPSSSAPQYSLTRHNLIRCCGKCNSIKTERHPISDLNLKHPYFDNVYNANEVLFDVYCNDFDKNDEGDIIFDLETKAADNLTNYMQGHVNHALDELNISERVSLRVNTHLIKICREWGTYGASNLEIRNNFIVARDREFRSQNYKEYFAYKILSGPRVVSRITRLLNQP